jgi:hypothetical protein
MRPAVRLQRIGDSKRIGALKRQLERCRVQEHSVHELVLCIRRIADDGVLVV